jgi:hypothetical protein
MHLDIPRILLTGIAGLLRELLVPEVVEIVLNAKDVAQLFEQSGFANTEENANSSSESTDDDSHGLDEREKLETIVSCIHNDVRRLNDLSASLESPALNGRYREEGAAEAKALITRTPHDYSTAIREKFPDALPELISHLGQANFQRCQILSKLRAKLGKGENLAFVEPSAEPNKSENLQHEDSKDGSPRPSSTVSANTAWSPRSRPQSIEDIKLAQFSDEGTNGQPFDCRACGHTVMTAKRDQRRLDLKHSF